MSYTITDARIEEGRAISEAIENDDYGALRAFAQIAIENEEEEEAMRLLELSSQAYRNAWGYDESVNN